MARIVEPTKAQLKGWNKWVATRPQIIRYAVEKYGLEPWSLYTMKSTGSRVTLYSLSEDGTVTVNITGQFNAVIFDRSVFGVDPADLIPCDIPDQDEPLGTLLSPEQVDENIDALRVMARPDLCRAGEGRSKGVRDG